MLSQFNQTHALSQPQGPQFLSQGIGLEPFDNCFIHHAFSLFSCQYNIVSDF